MDEAINIVLIGNREYRVPIIVTIYSLKINKKIETRYIVHLLTDDPTHFGDLQLLNDVNFDVNIHSVNSEEYKAFNNQESTIRSANHLGLAKFDICNILSGVNKCIYLDSDIIVTGDLLNLYNVDIVNKPLAAVQDSGSLYYKHNYVKKCDCYFNSGVMVLNLQYLRQGGFREKLLARKKQMTDSLLMDQDVLNVEFDKKFIKLPIKYNFLYINLVRATGTWSIDQLNHAYGTAYKSLNEIICDSVILHYASKDKPWNNRNNKVFSLWWTYYRALAKKYPLFKLSLLSGNDTDKKNNPLEPLVTIIIPIYNTGKWLTRALDSIINQTYKNLQIILVDDGSEDNSIQIANEYIEKDPRFILLKQKNSGQSTARNRALIWAKGTYVYFFDSDDYIKPQTIQILVNESLHNNLDLVLFAGGESFYEDKNLERKFPQYKEYYKKKCEYNDVYNGCDLYPLMVKNRDYNVSPCLQFIKRDLIEDKHIFFYENIIYEDNLFSLQILLNSKRAKVITDELFIRTVRNQSTMTSLKNSYAFISHFKLIVALIQYACQLSSIPESTNIALFSQLEYFIKNTRKKYSETELKAFSAPAFNSAGEKLISMLLEKYFRGDRISEKSGILSSLISTLKRKRSVIQSSAINRNNENITNRSICEIYQEKEQKILENINLKATYSDNYYHKRVVLSKNFRRIAVEITQARSDSLLKCFTIGLVDISNNKRILTRELSISQDHSLQIDISEMAHKNYALVIYAGSPGKTAQMHLNVGKLVIRYF